MSRPAVVVASIALLVAVAVIAVGVDSTALTDGARALVSEPLLPVALVVFGVGFWLRALVWARLVPGLSTSMAWAAVHVSLLGNHLLPLRLGEGLRVWSVVRRAAVPVQVATASVITLRAADVMTLLGLAAGAGVWVLGDAASVVGNGASWVVVTVAVAGLVAFGAGAGWILLLRRRDRARGLPASVRVPGPVLVTATAVGWVLEAGLVFVVARAGGVEVGLGAALLVSCAAVLAQVVAITPGGFGTYEAGAVAAWLLVGVDPATGLALALLTHASSTLYAVATGAVAIFWPAPGEFGLLRLPRVVSSAAAPVVDAPDAPVVLILPAHDEVESVSAVVARAPVAVGSHPLIVVVVDDGSSDATADVARAAGAVVVAHEKNLGLGAAVRTGFAWARTQHPAAVVFCDADGEYAPEEVGRLVSPILAGTADYVVGSRFAGDIHHMHPHRRLGNRVLTRWVQWLARRRDITDAQSGYRALSPAATADAEIVHDYNYAQVLTLDLLAKGYRYAEVPISYRFRATGRSFVRLGRYLRMVVPAVHRELNHANNPSPRKPSESVTPGSAKKNPPPSGRMYSSSGSPLRRA